MSQYNQDALVWVNGQEGASLAADDRGFAYGDGVFETLRYGEERVPLLERHLGRIEASCKRLAISLDMQQLQADLDGFLISARQCARSGVAKLVVTRGRGGRGYRTDPHAIPTRVISAHSLPACPQSWATDGVAVRYCDTRLGTNALLAGMKHLNRLEQVLARLEWSDAEVAEGLMADARGRIVEGISTNLFLVSGGRLLTPAIETCGVAGVMRAFIIEEASRELGVPTSIISCERALLAGAQELFLCNSVIGVWPVRKLGTKSFAVGPVTRRIQEYVARHIAA